jgi:hypothetical protein
VNAGTVQREKNRPANSPAAKKKIRKNAILGSNIEWTGIGAIGGLTRGSEVAISSPEPDYCKRKKQSAF